MVRMDGGARAASGLFYQYLFTIEWFLTLIERQWPDDTSIWIEDSTGVSVDDPDVIDFAVHHRERGIVAVHQAKSTVDPSSRTMTAADAVTVLVRLSRSADCPGYVLTNNARPGRGIAELSEILGQDRRSLSDDAFLSRLRQLISGSEAATAAVASVGDSDAVDRLRRCRVEASGETSAAIRARISERIRAWRGARGLALGDRAARLLTNSLITEVFGRAAGAVERDPGYSGAPVRKVSLATFAGFLAQSPHLLAEGVGLDETSVGIHHVPSGEGVVRPEQLAAIGERFDNVRSRKTHRCALVGRSGIGKSRLAAMYAHNTRESYDRVCWINAESPDSILASIISQRRTLGLDGLEQRPADELAGLFRESVSTFTGRWLIVFDNARHPTQIERWLPQAGAANILITSNNSVHWTAFRMLPIPRMSNDQALELLRSRLEHDTPTTDSTIAAENAIVNKFHGWPLALQIVAAHFGSVSRLERGVHAYLAYIDDYVLDDESLDRDGYPRTLQAAIHICIDRLGDHAVRSEDPAATTGLIMLGMGSVFAANDIPEQILYATAAIPEELLEHDDGRPAMVPDYELPQVDRAVRGIRTESLIDQSESSEDTSTRELRTRIDINDIIQRIVRERFELEVLVSRSAAHLTSWLVHYLIQGRYAEAVAIQPHARAVLEHTTQCADQFDKLRWCAVLAGNLAELLDVQGQIPEAMRWLTLALQLQDAFPGSTHRAKAKASHQLFKCSTRLGGSRDDIYPYAEATVDALETAAAAQDAHWEAESLRFSIESWLSTSIAKAEFDHSDTSQLINLKGRVDALSEPFRSSATEPHHGLIRAVNGLLRDHRDTEALALIDATLSQLPAHEHFPRMIVSAYRIETLTYLGRLADVSTQLDQLATDMAAHPQVRAGIGTIVLDAGTGLFTEWVTGKDSRVVPLIERVVRLCDRLLVSDYDRYRHALLTAFDASVRGDYTGVHSILQTADSLRPSQMPDNVLSSQALEYLMSWLHYWLKCKDVDKTARLILASPVGWRPLDLMASSATDLLVTVSSRDIEGLRSSDVYLAQWTDLTYGADRIAELREPNTNSPIARLHIGAPEGIDEHSGMPADIDLGTLRRLLLTTNDHPYWTAEAHFISAQ
ncbi:NB-ARC domain-containing protein [Nocardia fusca]|uniref:NB-ARC domain-containing protein n=1 Tax=Nocardia fusca TaxID=941183 RepID=UPI0007A74847|nr:NB-ARC domain-containing protein [Nocardia fusca]